MSGDSRDILRDLYVQMTLFQIKPTTVVDYDREVFLYEYGNVRVTFDSNVKTSYRDTDFLNPELIMVDALDPNCVIARKKRVPEGEINGQIVKAIKTVGKFNFHRVYLQSEVSPFNRDAFFIDVACTFSGLFLHI